MVDALDGTPAAISALPSIVDAVQGDVSIIMDSGIRRGMDVAKALLASARWREAMIRAAADGGRFRVKRARRQTLPAGPTGKAVVFSLAP